MNHDVNLALNLASDIYLPCHNFIDEGLTVFFEEFDLFVNLLKKLSNGLCLIR